MDRRFESFSPEHGALVLLFLVGCVVAPLLARRLPPGPEQWFRRVFAAVLVLVCGSVQVSLLLPGEFELDFSLPLHLCDLAWPLAAFALLTRSRRAAQLLYYWALVLSSQAVLTPALDVGFPDPLYVQFWTMHLGSVWAASYLTFGLGIRPTWGGFRFAVLLTAAWAVTMLGFNALADTNYGYVNEKPPVGSILDLFGPWPWYLLVEAIAIIAVWALITWPWTRRGSE